MKLQVKLTVRHAKVFGFRTASPLRIPHQELCIWTLLGAPPLRPIVLLTTVSGPVPVIQQLVFHFVMYFVDAHIHFVYRRGASNRYGGPAKTLRVGGLRVWSEEKWEFGVGSGEMKAVASIPRMNFGGIACLVKKVIL